MDFRILRGFIPYVSVFIIAIGIIKTIIFYGFFGIRILDYIGIEEIVILFADDILLTIVLYILPMIYYESKVDFISWFGYESLYNYDFHKPLDEDDKYYRMYLKRKRKRRIRTFITFFVVYCILLILTPSYLANAFCGILFICLLTIHLYFDFCKKYKNATGKIMDNAYDIIVMTSVSFLLFTTLLTIFNIGAIRNNLYGGSVIVTENATYKTDSNKIYVGKTNDFVYMYDLNRKLATIIPTSEIKEITIKKKGFFVPSLLRKEIEDKIKAFSK